MANNRKQVQPVVPATVTPELVGDKALILTLGLEEQIRARAYELYEQRGRQDGHHEDDWRQAEAEILARELKKTTPKQLSISLRATHVWVLAEMDHRGPVDSNLRTRDHETFGLTPLYLGLTNHARHVCDDGWRKAKPGARQRCRFLASQYKQVRACAIPAPASAVVLPRQPH
jgi:Protein of unknown function (DUF2934)